MPLVQHLVLVHGSKYQDGSVLIGTGWTITSKECEGKEQYSSMGRR